MIILIDRSLCQTNDGLVFKGTKTEEQGPCRRTVLG